MPCPHCFASNHTAAACPMFAQIAAIAATTRGDLKERPAEKLFELLAKIPTADLTPATRDLLVEIIAQVADMQRDIENIHVSLDMEGL